MSKVSAFSDKPRKRGKEIRIDRVSPMMHEEVKNIAAHLGISVTDFLKTQLLHIIAAQPKHYREPMPKD